ncbi:MAG: hypothetical protein SFY92_02580 [Verrucomicrobiae bacterium]|nr:hypothetical protein [Verrucomicrobiae bacterium]
MARLILHPAGTPAWNMGADEALWQLSPEPVLRLYSWGLPCLSLGYFQKISEISPSDRPCVRRITGGGLVDHTRDFTFTLTLPSGHRLARMTAPESYATIHEGVAQALGSCGLTATLAACCAPEKSIACFQAASKYDLLLHGAKIGGGAQKRGKTGLLHQGSLLTPLPLPAHFAEELSRSVGRLFGQSLNVSALTPAESAFAQNAADSRYGTVEWTQRF